MANLTLYSLSDYNAGLLIPKTFDLDILSDKDEYLEAISDWLNEVTEKMEDGEVREEWIVCDYEDIPSKFVGEYDLDEAYWDYKEAIENSHLDADVIQAWVDYGNDLNINDIESAYQGEFDNDEKFLDNYLDMCGIEEPSFFCIDWEQTAKNLIQDYFESNGHYFSNCW